MAQKLDEKELVSLKELLMSNTIQVLLVEGDGAVDVGLDAPPPAALEDLVASLCEGSGVQHRGQGKQLTPTQSSWRARLTAPCEGLEFPSNSTA